MAFSDPEDPRDLRLEKTLEAPRGAVWRCLTEPQLLKRWFAPKPWVTPIAELEVWPGGRQYIEMRGPKGEVSSNPGVYLEVTPERRIVVTSAFTEAWVPADEAFLTAIWNLADGPKGTTKYQAIARHWTTEARDTHKAMGFQSGWKTCAEQLEALAKSL